MRKIGLLIGFIVLLSTYGCKSDGDTYTYSKYYIESYVDGNLTLEAYYSTRSLTSDLPIPSLAGFEVALRDEVYYQSPEWKGAQHPDEFLRIAQRNGDTEFNNWKSPPEQNLMAFADHFIEIRITSDKDWSAEYPAGAPLNSKMGIQYISYAQYIDSGYPGIFLDDFDKKHLVELRANELRMIKYTPYSSCLSFLLYFEDTPDKPDEVHTFTVELTTVEGNVKTASITCTPEVDPALQ